MSILRLVQSLKGGTGSGNFGHSGRPGKVGGSTSSAHNYGGIIVKGKPTLGDFITLHQWEKNGVNTHGVPVYMSESELPSVRSGHTRLAHGTRMRNIDSITSTGLRSGKDVRLGEEIDTILGVKGSASSFGNVSVVFDLPNNDKSWHSINSEWVEIGRTVKPSEIRGLVLHKLSATPNELSEIISTYRERYGEDIRW